jgi:hypothetical protein
MYVCRKALCSAYTPRHDKSCEYTHHAQSFGIGNRVVLLPTRIAVFQRHTRNFTQVEVAQYHSVKSRLCKKIGAGQSK